MSKPIWDDAPEWANYLAMDSNGRWCWYENEPSKIYGDEWAPCAGKIEEALSPYDAWENSLEPRPK